MKLFGKFLMIAAVAFTTISCETEGVGKEDDKAPHTLKLKYSYQNTEDFYDLMNVRVEYIDIEGSLISTTITENWEYEQTISYDKAPKEYKCTIYAVRAVSGIENPKDTYTVGSKLHAGIYVMDKSGKESFSKTSHPEKNTGNIRDINGYLDLWAEERVVDSFNYVLNK